MWHVLATQRLTSALRHAWRTTPGRIVVASLRFCHTPATTSGVPSTKSSTAFGGPSRAASPWAIEVKRASLGCPVPKLSPAGTSVSTCSDWASELAGEESTSDFRLAPDCGAQPTSPCNARTGSIFEVRRAGRYAAVSATSVRTTATPAYVTGSVALTPYNWLAMTRLSRNAATSPRPTPARDRRTPSMSTRRTMSSGSAPTAMRMPSSLVLASPCGVVHGEAGLAMVQARYRRWRRGDLRPA